MNIEKIQQQIKEFSKQRDWDKHHNPKNLVMALSVEASELLEIFQWLESNQTLNLSEDKLTNVKEEVADIAIYLIRVCMAYNINLEEAIFEKMRKNELKYPLVDNQGNKIYYKKN